MNMDPGETPSFPAEEGAADDGAADPGARVEAGVPRSRSVPVTSAGPLA